MTITLRDTKGNALTYGELDENFRDLRYDTTLERVLVNGNSAVSSTMTVLGITTDALTANSINTKTLAANSVNFSNFNTNSLIMPTPYTPANSTAIGVQGQITWDADYVYVCVSNGVWKRSPLTTW